MSTWIDRVIKERKELQDNMSKLSTFIENDDKIENRVRNMLRLQLRAMGTYEGILTFRLLEAGVDLNECN